MIPPRADLPPHEPDGPGRVVRAPFAYTPADPATLTLALPDVRAAPPDSLPLPVLYGVIALLHLAGIGAILYYRVDHPALIGLGLTAYLFGLRHAFDADHIAAIDDTVRLMVQTGRRPLGVGFFFSLGHSTVVLLLSVAVVLAAEVVRTDLPGLRTLGAVLGTAVSGAFLCLAGVLNLLVLLGLLQAWRGARPGQHSHAHVDQLLAQRGLMKRLLGGRLRFITRSWQMYPLGLLFGLGFDTASEIGLLAMTAGAAAGDLPLPAALALPVLFTAGMSVMDTTDGVLMTHAYAWAFVNPARKLLYNLTTTSLSVLVALVIGSVEVLQVCIGLLGLRGGMYDRIAALDFGWLGYVIVGLFLAAWAVSLLLWGRQGGSAPAHSHEHLHEGGIRHRHEHFH
jgi:nickel/cobalt transporter (NiCoT) family protein